MQQCADNTQVDGLLKRAAEFAAVSVTNAITRLDDGAPPRSVFYDCLEQMHELEVHFLFPNLSPGHRDLLVRLLNARRALAARLELSVHRDGTRGTKREGDLLTQLKRQFVQLEGRTSKLAEEMNLTPSQREILEREFLGFPSRI